MKIFKRILIVFGVLVIIYAVIGLLRPSNCHVERSIIINKDAMTVFNEINTLKQWKNWSYWDNIDPKMKSAYEGPESGVGAKHSWESENDSVGIGSLTISKSEPGKFIETELFFEGMGISVGGWKIKDTIGGVYVTTYMDMDMPFYVRPMMMFMDLDAMLGADFDKSLAGLKTHCESLASVEMIAEIQIEKSVLDGMKILTIMDSCDEKEISAKLGQLYGELGAESSKQGLKQAGPVFGIYHRVDMKPDGGMWFVMEAGFVVDKPGKNAGRIKYSETTQTNTVKGYHYGAYDQTPASHDQINAYLKSNNLVCTGPVWEVYVTDPGTEPDPSKWLTEIYYPIK